MVQNAHVLSPQAFVDNGYKGNQITRAIWAAVNLMRANYPLVIVGGAANCYNSNSYFWVEFSFEEKGETYLRSIIFFDQKPVIVESIADHLPDERPYSVQCHAFRVRDRKIDFKMLDSFKTFSETKAIFRSVRNPVISARKNNFEF